MLLTCDRLHVRRHTILTLVIAKLRHLNSVIKNSRYYDIKFKSIIHKISARSELFHNFYKDILNFREYFFHILIF